MEPFKNVFSPELVRMLALHMQRQMPQFDRKGFEAKILERLAELELKQRSSLIAHHVHFALPKEPAARASILFAMLHPDETGHANKTSDELGICGWAIMPLAELMGLHGLSDFDRSMELLRQMTKRSSSEFAIRNFILADQDRALDIIHTWVDDPNYHVRRLVCEGTRPRLPWAMQLPRLIQDPAPMMASLFTLKDDPSEYVRRSVANHLNDIAKDHPELVASLAGKWMKGASAQRQKLVRHATRTLVKQGHAGALLALGIQPPSLKLPTLRITSPKVRFGEALEFEVEISSTSDTPQRLIVDYVLHFKKANGTLAPKTFKWVKLEIEPGAPRNLSRRHPIRPITTRKYYAGTQGLSLRINGKDFGHVRFELLIPSSA